MTSECESPKRDGNPIVRMLQPGDFQEGFLVCLRNLTQVGEIGDAQLAERLALIQSNPHHLVLVAEHHGEVVGTTTLLVEPKFIRACGSVGHIEDVATRKDWERRGVGAALVQRALDLARDFGCYKVILDCADNVIPFYERLGFRRVQNCLRVDL